MMHSKHKPYLISTNPASSTTTVTTTSTANTTPAVEDDTTSPTPNNSGVGENGVEEKKLEMTLSKQPVDKQWNLLGPYLGQYIVYTGESTAWLLS